MPDIAAVPPSLMDSHLRVSTPPLNGSSDSKCSASSPISTVQCVSPSGVRTVKEWRMSEVPFNLFDPLGDHQTFRLRLSSVFLADEATPRSP